MIDRFAKPRAVVELIRGVVLGTVAVRTILGAVAELRRQRPDAPVVDLPAPDEQPPAEPAAEAPVEGAPAGA